MINSVIRLIGTRELTVQTGQSSITCSSWIIYILSISFTIVRKTDLFLFNLFTHLILVFSISFSIFIMRYCNKAWLPFQLTWNLWWIRSFMRWVIQDLSIIVIDTPKVYHLKSRTNSVIKVRAQSIYFQGLPLSDTLLTIKLSSTLKERDSIISSWRRL